ncbi:unnamed protein product [Penicillium olsonii]|nr:unnamed protein product [Penicillium olsonii]CAG7929053.1 unnamed protein product [Penicillium olsonii]
MHVLAIISVFVALSTLTVGLRLFTRFYLVKAPGLDDVFVSASLYLWLSIPFYNLSLILSKLSALWFFTRLFRSRLLVRVSYALIGFLALAGLWMVLSGFFFCVPVHYFWTRKDRDDHCLPQAPVWILNGAIHIVTDVIILALPMYVLWTLKVPKPLKAGIITVFGLGVCVIGTSSARLYFLTKVAYQDHFTETSSQITVWSSLESNISIICVCLPPIHPLLSRIFSFCFLPQPLHSSPGSRKHSTTTQLTDRKHSIYDYTSTNSPERGIWYNELFRPGPASYTASISKINTREEEPDNEGIRVVRELRMQSDTVDADLEMARMKSHEENGRTSHSVEWDLGDFEFPDYEDRMNAPLTGRDV